MGLVRVAGFLGWLGAAASTAPAARVVGGAVDVRPRWVEFKDHECLQLEWKDLSRVQLVSKPRVGIKEDDDRLDLARKDLMTSVSAANTSFENYRIVRLDRCAVFVSMAQPMSITEQDALEILQKSFELTQHRQYALLMDMSMILNVSPEARRVFSSARNILVAAMVGRTPMDRMLSAPYEHATYPSEYFTDKDEALQWLRLMHDMLCQDPVEHTLSLTIDLDPFRTRHQNAAVSDSRSSEQTSRGYASAHADPGAS